MHTFRLRPEEEAALYLRGLYSDYGYSFYRMSRFEEYDFYSDKKDFLPSPSVLTFTDADGRMKALRPDVTLSIIKHFRAEERVQKYFYDEKVYRVPRNSAAFREIPQAGIECMGDLDEVDTGEVIELAVKSLQVLAGERKCVLDVCHAGTVAALLPEKGRAECLECIRAKNIHGLKELGASEELLRLMQTEGHPSEVGNVAGLEVLSSLGEYDEQIRVDFSAVSSLSYYNGIVFRGFIEGVSECVLSGGQYDNLMKLMGHEDAQGIGFAVNWGDVHA
ncbi:MAG: ATP phosphoribosyltransferase regulatory subunit [Synergistaceae bacterium]|nr:ATP phosphoribosyltransferase regulatory subunit [Synergistaceae bacterium]